MPTRIDIDGTRFCINGLATYEGRVSNGRPVEGLLFNSRMIQAIFDDENPETAVHWRYPDTRRWDPERNTDEFCAALPLYRRHGLLGVTVGLQGGGSVFVPEVYERYLNTAYTPSGEFKPAYFDRLGRVLKAADEAGVVVIVNYFYWKQAARLESDAVIRRVTAGVTDWLLQTGRRNILVDVMNESGPWRGTVSPLLTPDGVHELIEIVQQTTREGRRLWAGASTLGGAALPQGRWQAVEDFHMPHGNGCAPDTLREKLRRLKDSEQFRRRPRPILINEDSIFVENLEAAVDEYASWGFYAQGYGSAYKDRMDWKTRSRESRYEDLSGYQTVPINWGINSPEKAAFFARVAEITGSPLP
mgnify:CR=1 FL=1